MSSSPLTRRALIAGAGTALAGASMAVPFATASSAGGYCSFPVAKHDPLVDAIHAYRAGLADYEAFARTDVTDEARDAYAERSYQPPMFVLDGWDHPAVTREGAAEALRLAVEEHAEFGGGSNIVQTMLKAALGYFEQNIA